ncbi:MAG: hypothetical protein HQK81_09320 [Desulfovibrionaceae bacterium]|nr:hypothetical protein [Desulfovibrionaceae bacterium]MBF0514239.1 hypothetical protein [Desulfovibrionaceae bacterium]
MQTKPTRLRIAIRFLSVCIFVLALILPMLGNIFGLDPEVVLMEAPPLPMPKFEFKFRVIANSVGILRESYLEKVFGFRKLLVRMQNILDVIYLSSSTMYDPVLLTPDKWFFLAKENNDLNVLEDFRNVNAYAPAQLDYWREIFSERKKWLDSQGIKYLMVICPNKSTVYPERVPAKYNQAHSYTRLDQLINHVRAGGIDVLDLREALKKESRLNKAYYETDSHWTTYGALAGYREIVEHLSRDFPGIKPKELSDFNISFHHGFLNSLSSMLALGNLFPEDRIIFIPKLGYKMRITETPVRSSAYFQPTKTIETDDPGLPKAIVFRDSFAEELLPLLGEHFSRALFLWPFPTDRKKVRYFDKAIIASEKPDVVIEEFVERYFVRLPVAE